MKEDLSRILSNTDWVQKRGRLDFATWIESGLGYSSKSADIEPVSL